MKKNKILVIATTLAMSLMLFGCGKTEEPPIIDSSMVDSSVEDILLEYDKGGMELLKANFTTKDSLTLALKNIGKSIPDYELNVIKGENVNLKELKGKKILLEVLQPNCDACIKSTPIIDKALKDKDILLVPVFVNASNKTEIEDYYEKLNLEVPNLASIDTNKKLIKELNLTKTPSLLFIDEEGNISFINDEFADEKTFLDQVEFAFGENKIYEHKNN